MEYSYTTIYLINEKFRYFTPSKGYFSPIFFENLHSLVFVLNGKIQSESVLWTKIKRDTQPSIHILINNSLWAIQKFFVKPALQNLHASEMYACFIVFYSRKHVKNIDHCELQRVKRLEFKHRTPKSFFPSIGAKEHIFQKRFGIKRNIESVPSKGAI